MNCGVFDFPLKIVFAFTAKVVLRSYHVYKNTGWDNVGEKVAFEIEKNNSNLTFIL